MILFFLWNFDFFEQKLLFSIFVIFWLVLFLAATGKMRKGLTTSSRIWQMFNSITEPSLISPTSSQQVRGPPKTKNTNKTLSSTISSKISFPNGLFIIVRSLLDKLLPAIHSNPRQGRPVPDIRLSQLPASQRHQYGPRRSSPQARTRASGRPT